jgi:hypothetical protein
MLAEVHFPETVNHPHEPRQSPTPEARCAASASSDGAPAEMHFRKIANQPYGPGQPRGAQGAVRSYVAPAAGAAAEMHSRKNREPTLWIWTTAAHPKRGGRPDARTGARGSPNCALEKSRTNPTDPDNRGGPEARSEATYQRWRPALAETHFRQTANHPHGPRQPPASEARRAATCRSRRRPLAEMQFQ